MLSNIEMLEIAERYLTKMKESNKIELILYGEIKKSYGNIYFYNSEKCNKTGEFKHLLAGNAPFLVEKETGRIVGFGTAHSTEYYIKEYENGTLFPCLGRYWYPEDDRYSHE